MEFVIIFFFYSNGGIIVAFSQETEGIIFLTRILEIIILMINYTFIL